MSAPCPTCGLPVDDDDPALPHPDAALSDASGQAHHARCYLLARGSLAPTRLAQLRSIDLGLARLLTGALS